MKTLPPADAMYRALLARDAAYEGVFVIAVKTTSFFCRPTCTARKPRRRNVEFFRGAAEAQAEGYRACKICRPMEPAGVVPDWLRPALAAPGRMRDADLRARGISPSRVRRWFKAHHRMTFHAYRRSLRLNGAVERLRRGDRVIDAALGAGYEALSAFTESFKKAVGVAPSAARTRRIIAIARFPTPLGPMVAGATGEGICLLEFADRRMLRTQFKRLRSRFDAEPLRGESPFLQTLERQLAEYFQRRRRSFDVPLALRGTPFQEQVWSRLIEIPYGSTLSYGALAADLGRAGAQRAVARANGDNRIAILVPCHRVIGADGRLTGYGGGLWRKRRLLELEGAVGGVQRSAISFEPP